MSKEEQERLERFRRGEPGAFDSLYAEYGPRIYRFCLRLCNRGAADAEDLTQEVFVAAFKSLHRFEGRSSLSTYLYKIAVYRWREMREQQRKREGRSDRDSSPEDAGNMPPVPDPACIGTQRMELSAALATLPEAQREAFLLVKGEGFTCREAADALDIPVGTVKFRVYEATLRLKAYLTAPEKTTNGSPQPQRKEAFDAL